MRPAPTITNLTLETVATADSKSSALSGIRAGTLNWTPGQRFEHYSIRLAQSHWSFSYPYDGWNPQPRSMSQYQRGGKRRRHRRQPTPLSPGNTKEEEGKARVPPSWADLSREGMRRPAPPPPPPHTIAGPAKQSVLHTVYEPESEPEEGRTGGGGGAGTGYPDGLEQAAACPPPPGLSPSPSSPRGKTVTSDGPLPSHCERPVMASGRSGVNPFVYDGILDLLESPTDVGDGHAQCLDETIRGIRLAVFVYGDKCPFFVAGAAELRALVILMENLYRARPICRNSVAESHSLMRACIRDWLVGAFYAFNRRHGQATPPHIVMLPERSHGDPLPEEDILRILVSDALVCWRGLPDVIHKGNISYVTAGLAWVANVVEGMPGQWHQRAHQAEASHPGMTMDADGFPTEQPLDDEIVAMLTDGSPEQGNGENENGIPSSSSSSSPSHVTSLSPPRNDSDLAVLPEIPLHAPSAWSMSTEDDGPGDDDNETGFTATEDCMEMAVVSPLPPAGPPSTSLPPTSPPSTCSPASCSPASFLRVSCQSDQASSCSMAEATQATVAQSPDAVENETDSGEGHHNSGIQPQPPKKKKGNKRRRGRGRGKKKNGHHWRRGSRGSKQGSPSHGKRGQ